VAAVSPWSNDHLALIVVGLTEFSSARVCCTRWLPTWIVGPTENRTPSSSGLSNSLLWLRLPHPTTGECQSFDATRLSAAPALYPKILTGSSTLIMLLDDLAFGSHFCGQIHVVVQYQPLSKFLLCTVLVSLLDCSGGSI
jgi:hypothetical protein